MTKAVWGARLRTALMLGLAVTLTSCGDLTREGTGSSYLIVRSFEAASGAEPEEFGSGVLYSDVITIVEDADNNKVATIFSDIGRVRLTLGMKDPGGTASPTSPTTANFITINRYRVRYIRADGRNTPGVDVPHPLDGGLSVTVGGGDAEAAFEIVRHVAKEEAPLLALQSGAVIITTIAEVTFYGHDQTGREANVTARITIEFGNFGDPT